MGSDSRRADSCPATMTKIFVTSALATEKGGPEGTATVSSFLTSQTVSSNLLNSAPKKVKRKF